MKLFLYPLTSRLNNGSTNPYMEDLTKSLGQEFNVVNADAPSKIGVLNILYYLFRIDVAYFNWIENIPERKGGKMQMYFFMLLVFFMKMLNIRIIWTMHNKISHHPHRFHAKKRLFIFLLKNADLIIAHSTDGINYGRNYYEKANIHYIPHPFKSDYPTTLVEKSIDILIWGAIHPYKGIDKYLKYLSDNQLINKYDIMIAGKCSSEEYSKHIKKFTNNNIQLRNDFLTDEELNGLIVRAKLILFTYNNDSVLSSGALVKSIGHKSNVIGPDIGSFKDLAKEGIVFSYASFDTSIEIIDKVLNNDYEANDALVDAFIHENSWAKFPNKIGEIIST